MEALVLLGFLLVVLLWVLAVGLSQLLAHL